MKMVVAWSERLLWNSKVQDCVHRILRIIILLFYKDPFPYFPRIVACTVIHSCIIFGLKFYTHFLLLICVLFF